MLLAALWPTCQFCCDVGLHPWSHKIGSLDFKQGTCQVVSRSALCAAGGAARADGHGGRLQGRVRVVEYALGDARPRVYFTAGDAEPNLAAPLRPGDEVAFTLAVKPEALGPNPKSGFGAAAGREVVARRVRRIREATPGKEGAADAFVAERNPAAQKFAGNLDGGAGRGVQTMRMARGPDGTRGFAGAGRGRGWGRRRPGRGAGAAPAAAAVPAAAPAPDLAAAEPNQGAQPGARGAGPGQDQLRHAAQPGRERVCAAQLQRRLAQVAGLGRRRRGGRAARRPQPPGRGRGRAACRGGRCGAASKRRPTLLDARSRARVLVRGCPSLLGPESMGADGAATWGGLVL